MYRYWLFLHSSLLHARPQKKYFVSYYSREGKVANSLSFHKIIVHQEGNQRMRVCIRDRFGISDGNCSHEWAQLLRLPSALNCNSCEPHLTFDMRTESKRYNQLHFLREAPPASTNCKISKSNTFWAAAECRWCHTAGVRGRLVTCKRPLTAKKN